MNDCVMEGQDALTSRDGPSCNTAVHTLLAVQCMQQKCNRGVHRHLVLVPGMQQKQSQWQSLAHLQAWIMHAVRSSRWQLVADMHVTADVHVRCVQVQVVVATPGRLWELMQEGHAHLTDMSNLAFFVLDEADRMVQTGHFQVLPWLMPSTTSWTNVTDLLILLLSCSVQRLNPLHWYHSNCHCDVGLHLYSCSTTSRSCKPLIDVLFTTRLHSAGYRKWRRFLNTSRAAG